MGKPKKEKPQQQPTDYGTGPYTWGNGPRPYGPLKRLINKLKGK